MCRLLDSRPNHANGRLTACARRDKGCHLHNQSHRVSRDALLGSPTMRTLFLTAHKAKHRSLRYVLQGLVLLALLLGLHEVIQGLLGRTVSPLEKAGLAILVGAVAVWVRWFQLRRLKSDSRNLKDSALW